MTGVLDFIAEWSVRIIGTVGLLALTGWLVLWLIDQALSKWLMWKGIFKAVQRVIIEQAKETKRTKPLPTEERPDPRRPLD